jgi:hypothetical protein
LLRKAGGRTDPGAAELDAQVASAAPGFAARAGEHIE